MSCSEAVTVRVEKWKNEQRLARFKFIAMQLVELFNDPRWEAERDTSAAVSELFQLAGPYSASTNMGILSCVPDEWVPLVVKNAGFYLPKVSQMAYDLAKHPERRDIVVRLLELSSKDRTSTALKAYSALICSADKKDPGFSIAFRTFFDYSHVIPDGAEFKPFMKALGDSVPEILKDPRTRLAVTALDDGEYVLEDVESILKFIKTNHHLFDPVKWMGSEFEQDPYRLTEQFIRAYAISAKETVDVQSYMRRVHHALRILCRRNAKKLLPGFLTAILSRKEVTTSHTCVRMYRRHAKRPRAYEHRSSETLVQRHPVIAKMLEAYYAPGGWGSSRAQASFELASGSVHEVTRPEKRARFLS
jgi:hypothetical protein